MELTVFLTPHAVTERDVEDRCVVVIDVLRAASTIVTALSHGARAFVPVPDMEAASRLAMNRDADSQLLGGERFGTKIDGFDLGNSPLEYTPEVVGSRAIIFKTTNGTGAILKGRGARNLYVASFLNVQAVVDRLVADQLDVAIICAGWRGLTSFEDTLCAGMIVDRLCQAVELDTLPDPARIARRLYLIAAEHLEAEIASSDHARRLVSMGHEADVHYCSQVDLLSVVPAYRDQLLVVAPPGEDPAPGRV